MKITDIFFLVASIALVTNNCQSYRKKPPEVFCKRRCSETFCKIHRKTPVLESLFNKVAANALSFDADACYLLV